MEYISHVENMPYCFIGKIVQFYLFTVVFLSILLFHVSKKK